MSYPEILKLMTRVLQSYDLDAHGVHGIGHWSRVLDNGRQIAKATGADSEVVDLFAVFHDSRRVNDGYDPDHGERGSLLAEQLRGKAYDVDDARFAKLKTACVGHTHVRTHHDVTIATCWDADRLDLGRTGTAPHRSKLAILFDRVDEAASQELVRQADGRAAFQTIPDWLRTSHFYE